MKYSKNTKIGVLLGGLSKEREISFKSGRGMASALKKKGYKSVKEIDVGHDLASVISHEMIEVAVIALHGLYGEDGTVQGLLEFSRVPYTGSGVRGSAIAMDKIASKRLFQSHGIPTPKWLATNHSWTKARLIKEVLDHCKLPAVAKPVSEGSTIGLSIVRTEKEIEPAQTKALKFDEEVLWENYIQGTELTVGFLSNQPLPLVEIVPRKGLFDYEAKYTKGMTDYYCPARVSDEVTKKTQDLCSQAYYAVRAQSFGRVDLIYADGVPWILEVNTIPGMTETSLLPKAAKAQGKTFEDMVEEIFQDASLKLGERK